METITNAQLIQQQNSLTNPLVYITPSYQEVNLILLYQVVKFLKEEHECN